MWRLDDYDRCTSDFVFIFVSFSHKPSATSTPTLYFLSGIKVQSTYLSVRAVDDHLAAPGRPRRAWLVWGCGPFPVGASVRPGLGVGGASTEQGPGRVSQRGGSRHTEDSGVRPAGGRAVI